MKTSRRRVLDRLQIALEDGHVVRIERDDLDDGDLYGLVVGLSSRWVAVEQLADRIYPDGVALVRTKHVTQVRKDRDTDYVLRALSAMGHAPRRIDLRAETRTRDALEQASHLAPIVGFYDEHDDSAMWVGHLGELGATDFTLHFVSTDGRWDERTDRFPYSTVTLVESGTRYLDGIARFAAPAPEGA
ncbi:hypothetical protein [Aeromicrobium massiliense]|uniref:hypothetical protein n=1 Tax=Aeromicrobium massiliense TaxID=1464554 RepID=UPI00031DE89B|nr:hypothetical protein [Aeromicrobium massiliense]